MNYQHLRIIAWVLLALALITSVIVNFYTEVKNDDEAPAEDGRKPSAPAEDGLKDE